MLELPSVASRMLTKMKNKLLIIIPVEICSFALLLFLFSYVSGAFVFLLIGINTVLFLNLVKHLFELFGWYKIDIRNFLLFGISIIFTFMLFELILAFLQHSNEEVEAPKASKTITIPEKWKRRSVQIKGAKRSYYWHGKLHVHDDRNFRRNKPFPEKNSGILRVIVIGDSLTYGYGVGEKDVYPQLIENELKKQYEIEVINLGVSGMQSEDILKILREFLPKLSPDLIVYGVCLNDFLPSGMSQYGNNMVYQFPLPEEVKTYFLKKTVIGEFFQDSYNKLLITMGIRNDFYTDILENFDSYQTRFARDVRNMNNLVLTNGLPSITTMVLHRDPSLNSQAHKITIAAEKHLRDAGMDVVPTMEYFKRYDGQGESLKVSKWEGHPNEKAHKIFAEMLVTHLLKKVDHTVKTTH